MNLPQVVSQDEWLVASNSLRAKEKEATWASASSPATATRFSTPTPATRAAGILLGTYNYLDLTLLGRLEDWEQPPGRADNSDTWLHRHDEYGTQAS